MAVALALVVSSRPGAVETLTVDRLNLSLAPGDWPVLVFKSEVPVDVAVFRQRDFKRGRPPVIVLQRVLEARLAMPTDVQGATWWLPRDLCRWRCGPAEWRRLCRRLDAGKMWRGRTSSSWATEAPTR